MIEAIKQFKKINTYARTAALKFLTANQDEAYSVYLGFPSKKIIEVTKHIEISRGDYPDTVNSNSYFSIENGRKLRGGDLFIPSKIDEFSTFLNREIRKGADKETLDCYETVDQKGI